MTRTEAIAMAVGSAREAHDQRNDPDLFDARVCYERNLTQTLNGIVLTDADYFAALDAFKTEADRLFGIR